MKVTEILENLRKGDIVPKRVLSVLKRAGKIYDYSRFGYLESQWVYFMYDEKLDYKPSYFGRKIKPGEKGSKENPFQSYEEFLDAGHNDFRGIKYKGFTFCSKYLSGCFNAYIVKSNGPCTTNDIANPTMSLWGAVC